MSYRFLLKMMVSFSLISNGFGETISIEVAHKTQKMDRLLNQDSKLERVATGFEFIEGPVWMGSQREGYILFSDIPANRVYQWTPQSREVTKKIDEVHDPKIVTGASGGSNGLLEDNEGRLVLFEHGMRRVARLDRDGVRRSLIDRFEGRRLNSPNDGVFHSSNALFFTDPPYGLERGDLDRNKEQKTNGIYRFDLDGNITLLASMKRPNGIGLSADERTLYVANSDAADRVWMQFEVKEDLSLGRAEILFDATDLPEPGVPDGFVVDRQGYLWASGPGGVVVISPEGDHLGTILVPELPANTTFDKDFKNLFITARTSLYRLQLRK
jgi:gluconolactonase